MDSGYYRAIMVWAWGVEIPDLKLPNGFSKALQDNVTAVMNYTVSGGSNGDILWSNGFYDFDPLDPGQSGENSIMPFLLSLTESYYSDPADFQDEVDTIGRRRLTEAQIPRQLSEDEPRWTHHPIFEGPDFPHLDITACNQPGWSYFLVWVAMETANEKQRKEFWQVMEDERVQPTMAYPPPEEGRRLEESFVGEACSEPVFVWSKRIHPAPSVMPQFVRNCPRLAYSRFIPPLHAASTSSSASGGWRSRTRVQRDWRLCRGVRLHRYSVFRLLWAAFLCPAETRVCSSWRRCRVCCRRWRRCPLEYSRPSQPPGPDLS